MKTKNYFRKAALLFLVGSAQFIMAQVPNYVPTNGLTSFWSFDGNANDSSSGGNNLATIGTPSYSNDRFGNANKAALFNGANEYFNLIAPNLPSGSASRTLSIWCYTSGTITNPFGEIPFSYGDLTNGGCYKRFSFIIQNATSIAWHGKCNPVGFIVPNTFLSWKHFVLTYDSITNTISFYQDGVLIGSQVLVGSVATTLNELRIGSGPDAENPAGNIGQFDGKIDEVGVWDRVLSSQEISNIYNQVTPYSDTCNAVSGSLTQGLVGYWPFCGNANDDSGNGNNGTVNGATLTTDRFGNANSAYTYNGTSSYINVPNSASLQFNGGITISAWINPNTIPASGASYILSKGADGGTPYSWTTFLDPTGKVGTSIFSNTTANSGGLSVALIPTNQWTYVTFSFDGSQYKCYINGVLNYSGVSNYTTFSNIYDLKFGRRHISGLPYFFNGKLDDIGIWNRALTTQEVTQLYNQNQCFTNTIVTDTLVINVGQLSFTNPISYANNITIYPNPASTQVNIAFNNITNLNGGAIKIINSLGQQVATTPITTSGTNTTMILSTWGGSGLYFVQIVNPQGQIVDIKKILLQ
jgi:hypothetical protein